MSNPLTKLFQDHVADLHSRTTEAMDACGVDTLVIYAGKHNYYFADDRAVPFEATPHFKHWVPTNNPEHVLVIAKGDSKPKLYYYRPDDFWHDQVPLGNPFWRDALDAEECGDRKDIWEKLKSRKGAAYIGPEIDDAKNAGFKLNPKDLTFELDWIRSFKTPFEIECFVKASERGAMGHLAAKQCFEDGGSELQIHQAFMHAVGGMESELPYRTIVGVNEKAAILHYEEKRSERDGDVMLIDAGARYLAFGSDITRTYARSTVPTRFKDLLAGMESLQLRLCDDVKPGVSMAELHHLANVYIGDLLLQTGLIEGISAEEAAVEEVVRTFFPHGLGHMLGIQVHDVAGQQSDRRGTQCKPPPQYPKLRSCRMLEPNMVLTIEPGLYFIPMLLKQAREKRADVYAWDKIEELIPYGGIRIEDDILVTESGHRNFTREFLP